MASSIFRLNLKPCFTHSSASVRSSFVVSTRHAARVPYLGTRLAAPRRAQRSLPLLFTATGLAGIGFGISSLTSPPALYCDAVPPSEAGPPLPPPPKSSVNAYELTFGTVCGICAGVFVKKSARAVAFFLGGLFVILQYLGSVSLVRVDWAQMASGFENLFYTTDAVGNKKPPTVRSIWRWVLDFLTADFQPRASFVVGFALGLRVG